MQSKPPGSIALTRYLERHIESNLPACPIPRSTKLDDLVSRWHHVLVIPAYRETPDCLQTLATLQASAGRILVLLVLNRPDTEEDSNCNTALRTALSELPPTSDISQCTALRTLNAQTEIYCVETEATHGALPAKEGVGLARKIGCDTAIKWMEEGAISSSWIHNSDADAHLPETYFDTSGSFGENVAAVHYPFWHRRQKSEADPKVDSKVDNATTLYELRLHQYVLGLRFAGSGYAFHTLGSCVAVRMQNYVQVRGFPKRAAGEDFYFLNKLAKTGDVASPLEPTIAIESRISTRVPFGTGPAVEQLYAAETLEEARIFYHPACFEALRSVLEGIQIVAKSTAPSSDAEPLTPLDVLREVLTCGLTEKSALELKGTVEKVLIAMKVEKALDHCHRQSTTAEQFLRQFHQWFDGFRTLKFIHAIREAGWPNQSLTTLKHLEPNLWPIQSIEHASVTDIRQAVNHYWGWKPIANEPWQVSKI